MGCTFTLSSLLPLPHLLSQPQIWVPILRQNTFRENIPALHQAPVPGGFPILPPYQWHQQQPSRERYPGDLCDTSFIWKHNIDVVGISSPGCLTPKATQAATISGAHPPKAKGLVGSLIVHTSSFSATATYYETVALLGVYVSTVRSTPGSQAPPNVRGTSDKSEGCVEQLLISESEPYHIQGSSPHRNCASYHCVIYDTLSAQAVASMYNPKQSPVLRLRCIRYH